MTSSRLRRLQARMDEEGVDAVLVGPGPDLRYLTGYHALPLERVTMLVVLRSGDARLVTPRLEVERAERSGVVDHAAIVAWEETDDPIDLVAGMLRGAKGGWPARIAVQDRLWSSFLLRLQARITTSWLPASQVLRHLRMIKEPAEIEALAAAAAAIDEVHAQVPSVLAVGRTEREVGHDLAELILDDHDEVNFVIVAAGPHGASPHHETGDRRLEPGDAVVVDIGGTRAGYCSDVTRNYVLGEFDPQYAAMHELLEAAQRTAVAAVRPGATAAGIDAAARSVIAEAGFGAAFIHRTGHGIGLEEHEEPWIVAGNDEELRPGMAFSVEPGIYLPGRHGARIEDIVVVTDDGVRNLNSAPLALTIVG